MSAASATEASPERILIVDDDEPTGRMMARILQGDGYATEQAATIGEALALARRQPFSLVISDVHLGAHSGVELVGELRARHPDLAALMVSGDDRPLVAAAAAERGGALGYLVKPFSPNELRIHVSNALLRRRLREYAAATELQLQDAVDARVRELEATMERLRTSQHETIRHLAKAVEMRDPATHRNIDRLGELSAVLARAAGWREERVELIRVAAPIHDLGKIGIPDRILLKPGPLDATERADVQRHTEIGYEILRGSGSELLQLAATIALTHHERFDGTGYPSGLSGEAIPEAGRLVAVADVFDSLVNDRPYRNALPLAEALRIIRDGRGSHFDPAIVDAFFGALDEVLAIERDAPAVLADPGLAARGAVTA